MGHDPFLSNPQLQEINLQILDFITEYKTNKNAFTFNVWSYCNVVLLSETDEMLIKLDVVLVY
jgi:hypothetical protein